MPIASVDHVAQQLGRDVGIWGAASVVAGATLMLKGSTPAQRAFGIQSAGWGAIDLAIVGLVAALPTPTAPTLRKILLINVGLDALYVAGGAHLAVRKPRFGGRITTDEAVGHGVAIVIQGAALFVFDAMHARMLR